MLLSASVRGLCERGGLPELRRTVAHFWWQASLTPWPLPGRGSRLSMTAKVPEETKRKLSSRLPEGCAGNVSRSRAQDLIDFPVLKPGADLDLPTYHSSERSQTGYKTFNHSRTRLLVVAFQVMYQSPLSNGAKEAEMAMRASVSVWNKPVHVSTAVPVPSSLMSSLVSAMHSRSMGVVQLGENLLVGAQRPERLLNRGGGGPTAGPSAPTPHSAYIHSFASSLIASQSPFLPTIRACALRLASEVPTLSQKYVKVRDGITLSQNGNGGCIVTERACAEACSRTPRLAGEKVRVCQRVCASGRTGDPLTEAAPDERPPDLLRPRSDLVQQRVCQEAPGWQLLGVPHPPAHLQRLCRPKPVNTSATISHAHSHRTRFDSPKQTSTA